MEILDRMHPRCRAIVINADLNFDLTTMPSAARTFSQKFPGRFADWFRREIDAARSRLQENV